MRQRPSGLPRHIEWLLMLVTASFPLAQVDLCSADTTSNASLVSSFYPNYSRIFYGALVYIFSPSIFSALRLSSPFRPLFLFPMLRLPGPGPLKYTILSHGSGSEPGHACISYMRASATCEPLLRYFPPAYSTAASLACCLCMPLYASV